MIGSGTDVNARCEDGTTPLHEAAYFQSKEAIEVLIRNCANINAMDIKGNKSSFIIVVCKKISLLEKAIDKKVTKVTSRSKIEMSLAAQRGNKIEYVSGRNQDLYISKNKQNGIFVNIHYNNYAFFYTEFF